MSLINKRVSKKRNYDDFIDVETLTAIASVISNFPEKEEKSSSQEDVLCSEGDCTSDEEDSLDGDEISVSDIPFDLSQFINEKEMETTMRKIEKHVPGYRNRRLRCGTCHHWQYKRDVDIANVSPTQRKGVLHDCTKVHCADWETCPTRHTSGHVAEAKKKFRSIKAKKKVNKSPKKKAKKDKTTKEEKEAYRVHVKTTVEKWRQELEKKGEKPNYQAHFGDMLALFRKQQIKSEKKETIEKEVEPVPEDVQSRIAYLEKQLNALKEQKEKEEQQKQKYSPIIEMIRNEGLDLPDFARYLQTCSEQTTSEQ